MKNLAPQVTFNPGGITGPGFSLPPSAKCVWNVGNPEPGATDTRACDAPATERVRIRIKQADVLAPLCGEHARMHRRQAVKVRKSNP